MTLALDGGTPVRRLPLPPPPPYGLAERNAANTVVASGQLSGFLGAPGEAFLGGQKVRDLERAWCEHFRCRHAVAMNSATSCLFGAVQALGLGPADEVIVTPWSMSASVSCVRAAGAVPVFADIEDETYGLDAAAVERVLTPRTKAIVAVDLFGQVPRDLVALYGFGLPIVEDAAQAIGATVHFPGDGVLEAGTVGKIGVYSLNRHKTLQCGEGGVAVTDDDDYAAFLRGYRNHGEVVRHRQGHVGGNYRLGEIEAAIAEVQLTRLEELTLPRIRNADRITAALSGAPGLTPPRVPANASHVYYVYALRVEGSARGFAEALTAEGIPAAVYVEPLYRLPAFRGYARRDDSGDWEGWYPCVERVHREVVVIPHVHAGMSDGDVDDVISAIAKVADHAAGTGSPTLTRTPTKENP